MCHDSPTCLQRVSNSKAAEDRWIGLAVPVIDVAVVRYGTFRLHVAMSLSCPALLAGPESPGHHGSFNHWRAACHEQIRGAVETREVCQLTFLLVS